MNGYYAIVGLGLFVMLIIIGRTAHRNSLKKAEDDEALNEYRKLPFEERQRRLAKSVAYADAVRAGLNPEWSTFEPSRAGRLVERTGASANSKPASSSTYIIPIAVDVHQASDADHQSGDSGNQFESSGGDFGGGGATGSWDGASDSDAN